MTSSQRWLAASVLITASLPCTAQTAQGFIAGRVFDANTQAAVADAYVQYFHRDRGVVIESGAVRTDQSGAYAIAFLAPGTYQLRVSTGATPDAVPQAGDYQPQEIYELQLFVASRLEVNFALRPLSDTWKAGIAQGLYEQGTTAVVHYFAADVTQLRSAYVQLIPYRTASTEATVSYVVDPQAIATLPLSGRDIYTTLVLQPGVTAAGATTSGLGLAANGQRSTSASYLLDGVENNNHLLTGPLTPISPEATQEYRVSMNSYSSEYGRTTGFLANAVTRAGGNGYHGLGFTYIGNDVLNANSFARNTLGRPRAPYKNLHAGYQVGGPIVRDRLFFSSEFEHFRSRGQSSPQEVDLPSLDYFERHYPGSRSTKLLEMFLPAGTLAGGERFCAAPGGSGALETCANSYHWSPTVSVDRSLALERFDYVARDQSRITGRLVLARSARPDFVASPYQGLDSRLSEDSTGLTVRYVKGLAPTVSNELRVGWTNFDLHWNRAQPGNGTIIPQLSAGPDGPRLPASELPFGFAYRENAWELSDSLAMVRGSHAITLGGGALVRLPNSTQDYYGQGSYDFSNFEQGCMPQLAKLDVVDRFGLDSPCEFQTAVQYKVGSATNPPFNPPDFNRRYSNHQFFAFAQDTWRLTPRLSISLGLRYESFGALRLTGAQDTVVDAGTSGLLEDRLKTASLVFDQNAQRSAYQPDRNNWAPRLGVSYSRGGTVFHASYGVYYDRPFDNLVQNTRLNGNGLVTVKQINVDLAAPFYSRTRPDVQTETAIVSHPEQIFWIEPRLRSPLVQSWFAGMERDLAPNLTLSVNYLGSSGSRLFSTDRINRQCSQAASDGVCSGNLNDTRFNPGIPFDITYRGNQSSSSYNAMTAVLRYRGRTAQFQVSYTWSHSIDNQSDPLAGDFLKLENAVISGYQKLSDYHYGFTRQFDTRLDRGNSDFDQRHNLVFYASWQPLGPRSGGWLAPLLDGWQLASVGGFRSGFPVNVFGAGIPNPASGGQLYLARPDVVTGQYQMSTAVPGGVLLLDKSAFPDPTGIVTLPGPSATAERYMGTRPGNLGRNSFAGPGFWSVDTSVARSFGLPGSETARLQFRADFFNVFNHANLGQPSGDLSGSFGLATYGTPASTGGFPPLLPLAEQARQIQLQLRLLF